MRPPDQGAGRAQRAELGAPGGQAARNPDTNNKIPGTRKYRAATWFPGKRYLGRYLKTITKYDVGKSFQRMFPKGCMYGKVLPIDVGKQVWDSCGCVCIESEQQRDSRMERENGRTHQETA